MVEDGLTGDEWHCLKFFPPVICDNYLILRTVCVAAGVAHLVCMSYKLLGIFMFDSVEDVEEIGPRWKLALGHLIREIIHESLVLMHEWP